MSGARLGGPTHTAVLGAVLSGFFLGAYLLVYWADDAYIFQRYAANAAAGNGLVYNIGERVEGFTSPLWMAVHVVLQTLGMTKLIWAQVLGALGCGALIILSARTPETWRPPGAPEWCAGVAPALIASHVGVIAYAGSGMETSLYILLVALAVVRRARERADSGLTPMSALWCALAFWTRPEAALVAAVCALFLVVDWKEGRRAFVWRWVAVATLPVAALIALRWSYYGDWLPNTYYAKSLPLDVGLMAGLRYAIEWLGWHAGWPVLALGAMVPLRRALPAGFGVIPLAALALAIASLFEGGDWMPFHRFLIPVVVLASLCAQQAVCIVSSRGLQRPAAIAIAVVCAVQLGVLVTPETNDILRATRFEVVRWLDIGQQLNERVDADDVVVVGAAGAFGVTLDSRVVDVFGLVDRQIARAPIRSLDRVVPGHVRSDANRVMSLEPEIILIGLIARDKPANSVAELTKGFWSRAHDDLLRHPGLANYRPLNLRYEDTWVAVLERKPEGPE